MAKSKKHLQPYIGELTPKEIHDGMIAASNNAKRLLRDAKILFDAKRYPSSLALAVLAIEEAGKLSILRGLAAAVSDWLKKGWREYRDHQSKNRMWIILDLVLKGAKKPQDLFSCFDGMQSTRRYSML